MFLLADQSAATTVSAMGLLQVASSSANPLGALFACHEDLGVSDSSADAACGLLQRDMLVVARFVIPGPLDLLDHLELPALASKVGARVVAAHHARDWFRRDLAGRHLVVFAFDSDVSGLESRLLLERELSQRVLIRVFPPIWGLRHVEARAMLAAGVESRDCGLLRRFGEGWDVQPASPVEDMFCACDSTDRLLSGFSEMVRSVYGGGVPRSDLRVEGMVRLLDHVGARSGDRRALLAAHLGRSDLSKSKLARAVDDVRVGRL